MEEASFLLAVQGVVGGIEVQHQLFGRGLEAGDELIHQHLMQSPGRLLIGPLLQPAQCGGAGDFPVNTDGCLYRHVLAQRTVVAEVLPAQCQSIDTLAQHVAHAMLDQHRAARISDTARCLLDQAQLAVRLCQQHDTAIAGHAAAVKAAFYNTSAKAAKFNLVGSRFFGTVWHWQSQL